MAEDNVSTRSTQRLPTRAEDFSEWYNQLVLKSDLADYAPVRGCMVVKPYGWVFFYQSSEFLRSRKAEHQLAGNSPILIDRINGELRVFGTARPIADYLEEYESSIPQSRLEMLHQSRQNE